MDLSQEQLVHELERKHMAAAEGLSAAKARVEALEGDLQAKLDEIEQHKATIGALKEAEQTVAAELRQATREKAQLEAQIKSLTSLSDQRLQEIHAERERVAELAKQLVQLQKSETKALQDHARLEAQLAPLQLEVNRLRKEIQMEKAHLEDAQAQLVEKNRLFTEFRLESHKKISDIEHQCISAKDDAADLRLQINRLNEEKQTLREELKVERESNLEIQTQHERVVGHLEKELAAQHRLTDLYKDAAQTASSKVEQLQTYCESLQTSLKEAEDALAEESRKVREESEQATMHLFQEQMKTSESKIDELEAALSKANARIAELEEQNEAAAKRVATIAQLSSTAGELHLAENGLSATDMYDRIVQLDATVQAERSAKEKLEVYLQRVLEEIQAKAPYLERLKKENARALASHDQLSDRLDSVTQELSKAREALRLEQKDKNAVEDERDSLKQTVADLSRQVKQLLYSSTSTAAPGSEESLVVFRNIEELQVRNQQLLKIVRDLSEKPNASKVIATVEPEEDLVPWSQAQWEKVNAELQQLREERLREQEMVAAVVKQRDMYRVLLSQADSRYIEAESKAPNSPRRQSLDLGSHDARLLRELRLEFEDYKKEKQQLVASLRDTVDSLRGEVSRAKVVAMEANVEAKSNQEKFRLAELRKNEFEEELVRFRSKYEQCNALMLQHQATIADLTVQIDSKTEALQKLEITHNSVSTERDYLKRQEERLTLEVTQLRLDSTNQLKLMDAVRRIESYQTDRTAQEVERLQAYSTSLEAQVAERQKALDDTTALASAKTAELTLELKTCQKQWDADKAALASLREARVGLEEQVRSLTKLCDVKSDEIQTLRAQLKKGAGVAAAERVSALETAIEDAKHELHAVLAAKQTAEQHAEQYKIIADAHEKSLAALSASSEKWKAEQEARLQAAIAERDSAKEEMTKLQKKMLDNMVEENKLRQEMDAWDAKKRAEVHIMEERALLAEKSLEVAKKEVATLKERLAQEDGELQRVRDDYSRELQKHSTAVIVCNDLRREIDEARRAAKDQELLVAQLEMSLTTAQNDHEKALLNLQNSVNDATAAKAALEEQNKLLHSQLEVLTQDINKEHEATLLKSTQGTESASDKQLRELRGVVTYLRREHEIAQSKLELAKQEALRYQTTAKALEKTVDRLKAEQEASIKLQSSALQTTEDQVKRSAQLDTLSLLRESNAMLREENEKNLKKVKEKDATIQALEAKLSPLQHSEGLLKGQIQNLKEDIESLNKANKRWKSRVDQLIEKYQQIDPEEHEKVCSERNALKEQVETLKKAAEEAAAELSKVQPRTEELEIRKKHVEERVEKLQVFVKNWKDRCIKAEARVSELEAVATEAEAKAKDGEKIIEEKIKAAELQAKKVLEEKMKLAEAEAKKALEAETEKNEKLTQFNSKLMAKVKTSAVQIAQLNEKLNAMENDKQASEESTEAVAEQPPATKPAIAIITKVEPAPVAAPTPAAPQVVKAPEVVPVPAVAQASTQLVKEVEKAPVDVPTPSPATKPIALVQPPLPTEPKPAEPEVASAAPAATSDDALREMALKSLLRKKTPLLAVKKDTPPPLPSSPAKAASVPAATTAAKPAATTALPTTTSKPPSTLNPTAPVFTAGGKSLFGSTSPKPIPPLNLPATDAPATSSPSKTSNPFLNLMPPTAFGSSGATGLVFGGNTKITLPVPSLPAEGAEPETEEQRLQQRLMRFKRAATSAVENAPPSKKAATDDSEETKEESKDKDGE